MPKSPMQYTQPQARALRKVATLAEFQDEDGNPDIVALATHTNMHRNLVKFLLTGELPAPPTPPAPEAKAKGGKDKDVLS